MAWLQVNFYSECLQRNVPIEILTPDEDGADNGLKTLYLLHGYGANQSAYLLDTPTKELSNTFHIAIVIVSGDNDFYLDRPESENYCGRYVGDEVVKFTRQLLPRLSHLREETLIGGLSMGAYGSLINGITYHNTFGHIIVNSTSLPGFLQESAEDAQKHGLNRFGINEGFYEQVFGPLDRILESDRNPMVRIDQMLSAGVELPDLFISVGFNDELCPALRTFVSELKKKKVQVEYREYPGTHETSVFNHSLREALCRIYGEPKYVKNMFWIENTPMNESIQ